MKELVISIHALTGSATDTENDYDLKYIISIHALTGSATQYAGLLQDIFEFQSTHSRGVRLGGKLWQ